MLETLNLGRSVRRHFDNAAQHYHESAVIQREIARELAQNLEQRKEVRMVLEIGCGTGTLTEHLIEIFPNAQLTVVELSPKMIEAAKLRLASPKNVRWVCDAIEHFAIGAQSFDLIVSSSTFQWVDNLEYLFSKLRQALRPDGTLTFSVMLEGTLCELRTVRQSIAPSKKISTQLPSFQGVIAALENAGFVVQKHESETIVEYFSDTHDLLSQIRRRGFTGGSLSRSDNLLNRSELCQLATFYNARYRNEKGEVRASFVSGLFEAKLAT